MPISVITVICAPNFARSVHCVDSTQNLRGRSRSQKLVQTYILTQDDKHINLFCFAQSSKSLYYSHHGLNIASIPGFVKIGPVTHSFRTCSLQTKIKKVFLNLYRQIITWYISSIIFRCQSLVAHPKELNYAIVETTGSNNYFSICFQCCCQQRLISESFKST